MRREILAAAGAATVAATVIATTVAFNAQAAQSADPQLAGSSDAAIEEVVIRDVNGDRMGTVVLRQTERGVRVEATPLESTPGFHGFHVHDVGICDPAAPDGPFTTAGGHYTGGASAHGDHAGDMPSLLVRDNGKSRLSFHTDRFTLAELRSGNGSAVMVHAGRDNFANIPERYESGGVAGPDAVTLATGDAGSRIGCGVID